MQVDHRIGASTTDEQIRALARRADRLGLAALWSSEAGHDPFLLLRPAIDASSRVTVGTAIAVAYARTPMATALASWDLQRSSGGRFVLGLGTQVRAHIERRYGTSWPGVAQPMREYVRVLRDIWACWQDSAAPSFRGEHYRFTLSSPEFEPAPLPDDQASIRIWLAAVGPVMAGVCGEVADGVHVHPFHSAGYLREVLAPALRAGMERSGRDGTALPSSSPVFAGVAHDEHERHALRRHFAHHIGFYASTPAYLPVLRHAGWEHVHEPLRALVRAGRWDALGDAIPEAMVDDFSIVDQAAALGATLAQRYEGLLTQVGLYRGGDIFMSEHDWDVFVDAVTRQDFNERAV